MIQAVVGSGGKTTLIHRLAEEYRAQGKKVFVTTTTHMRIEADTLLTDDPRSIIQALEETGYVMAGIREGEEKIRALPREVYEAVCAHADAVLVEADGSRGLPLKFPSGSEPVIPPAHVQRLVTEGYLRPLRARCPDKKVVLMPRTDGSLYQRAVASLLRQEQDVSLLKKEWFCPQPRLIVCGGGHVSREVAALAARLDFTTRVIDERPELLTRERFPTADELICDSYDNLEQHLEPGACYVVVTPNHKADFRCVAAILSTDYAYLGMMGSKRKVAATFEQLRLEGFSQQQIDTIFAPIGLPIGAVTPAEIALSILAQIIEQKNRHHIASADRSLLETTEQGVLCIVIEKHGSVPRGVGSMMLVTADHILGSIGGGEGEYRAICHAREGAGLDIQTYALHNDAAGGLDMVCGGTMKVLFLPV